MNHRLVSTVFAVLIVFPTVAEAEPYLAVREGLDCRACHTNPTGGGQRNAFGNAYSQAQLAVSSETGLGDIAWTGQLAGIFTLGGDARVSASQVDVDGQDGNLEFGVNRVSLYGGVNINEVVQIYVDQQVAPGGSLNREAWIQFTKSKFHVKAGKMFLPFGWRLEDNFSLVRQATGISMLQGDDGVEIGYESGPFVSQFSVTNGAGGGTERDDGKQISARLAWVEETWQVGISGADNNTDIVDRSMYGVFAGLNTGPVAWLFEYDMIDDSADASLSIPDVEQEAGLLEANWLIRKGHNLKVTHEIQSFDDATEDRSRSSLVYEYTPFPIVQLRIGYRRRDSDDFNQFFSSDEGFIELHAFF